VNPDRLLKHFLRSPNETGAVAASSDGLSELITDAAGLSDAKMVIEFGPGTGVFTEKIVAKVPPGAAFFAMETNAEFVEATRRRCSGVTVIHDSAVNCRKYMTEMGHEQCDSIVCGLPWAAFGKELQDVLLSAIMDALKPQGVFVTFAYLHGLLLPAGRRFRKRLCSTFSQVRTTRTVWMNIPPAFVYCARK